MAASISRAIRRFEEAVRDHTLKGSQDPEDRDHIQKTYEIRLRDLCHAVGIEPIKPRS